MPRVPPKSTLDVPVPGTRHILSGAGKGYHSVLGLTLGTGLGSALCLDGKCLDADLWNKPFQQGIAEDYISTRWFKRRYQEETGKLLADVKTLAMLAPQHQIAIDLFAEFGRNLGEFLSLLTSQHQLDAIVLGGNIARSASLFLPQVHQVLRCHDQQQVIIVPALLGEDAALIGSADFK